MPMRDGFHDKIRDIMTELAKDGHYTWLLGVDASELDGMHCDVCRLLAIQAMADRAAQKLYAYYKRQKENARSH